MAEKKEKAAPKETPQEQKRKEKKKSSWSVERCRSAASRFSTREEWASGAPSSYKAATARGWDAECCKHMKAAAPKVKKVHAPKKKMPATKKAS